MNILIPCDTPDMDEAKIILLEEAKLWLFIDLSEGRIQKHTFYSSKEDIAEVIEVLIVKNDKEYVLPFMQEGIEILMVTTQVFIPDIMEAFLFKELHELLPN